MGVRKNYFHMTDDERTAFLAALLKMKSTPANPGAPPEQLISIYDQFTAIHLGVVSVNSPDQPMLPTLITSNINAAHSGPAFCPWHRVFLRRFELALQAVSGNPNIFLPYWDWTDHVASEMTIFHPEHFGPDGGAGGLGGGFVRLGYFAGNRPGTGTGATFNSTALPDWYPEPPFRWQIPSGLAGVQGTTLARYHDNAFNELTSTGDVLAMLNFSDAALPGASNETKYLQFRANLESNYPGKTHGFIHSWMGGHMSDNPSAANDPIFYLHHCNIDRIWAMWQINGHEGNSFFTTADTHYGHNLNDPMWPWVGDLPGFTSNNITPASNIILPDFSVEPVVRCADGMNHRTMGYSYDTEVCLGIALDQTGSMLEMAPDPVLAPGPNITKWEAAKKGVAAVLHDCELALAAGEAYINAGVKTFRDFGGSSFTFVFPGISGLIKAGPASAFSQAQFNTLISGFTPGGGTPIAAALSDAENSLVRYAYGNLPANDPRYMMFFTDGNETVPPFLEDTIADHSIANTTIFAMGFGIASEVDYGMIGNITDKGKLPVFGTTLAYHGDNVAAIDNFYSKSIAHTINYGPMVDPVYELYPGEHVDTPFDITSADESFMLTAMTFDNDSESWMFCLVKPDGSQCNCDQDCDTDETGHGTDEDGHGHVRTHGPSTRVGSIYQHEHDGILVTSNKYNGRISIFMHRNKAKLNGWTGRWYLRAMYKMDDKKEMVMFMPSIYDLIYPVGAPPSVGPLYARLNQKPRTRQSVRLIPQRKDKFRFPMQGVNVERKDPSTISVNVYSRRILTATLTLTAKALFAGNDVEAILELKDIYGGTFEITALTGRLVAPEHSVGQAYLDPETIPVKSRRKYLVKTRANISFDQGRFLADYETKNQGAFPIRDEVIDFKETDKQGVYSAIFSNNKFPGVYHLTLFVEGTIQRPNGKPERFMRIAADKIALGILPDPGKTRTLIDFENNKLSFAVVPMDALGNLVSPANIPRPVIKINGTAVKSKYINDYSGQHVFGFNGERKDRGYLVFETVDGEEIVIRESEEFYYEICFNEFLVSSGKYKLDHNNNKP